MAFKIMLIYPNHKGMNMLPPAMGILSAILKRAGYQVKLFDTTYYYSTEESGIIDVDSDKSKTDKLMARPYTMPNQVTTLFSSCYEDFLREVESFGPDLLALSATEDMWELGIRLLKKVRTKHHIPTIAGGVFPTFAPDIALSYSEIDIVCKGEGEDALLELVQRMEAGKSYNDIKNLWVKRKDGAYKINPTHMCDMDKNPLIDMSLFEEARFYRPMGGKVYRMFPVETHRGCAFKCSYCNSPTQVDLYKAAEGKSYLRRKSFDNMRKELLYYKNEMKAEYLYFWADTFFSWHGEEFDQFCEIYQDIKLPFWCQTRVETLSDDRLKKLKDIGCARMSFGIEHGDTKFRREVIKRHMSNESIVRNLEKVKESGITFSVNNIMGFPGEDRELAFATVELNRQFYADDRNAYAFTPFHGTPLRAECERLGFIKHGQIVKSMVSHGGGILNMPQFSREAVAGLTKTFNLYVRFPKNRWPEIAMAEKETPEANRIFKNLVGEFKEKYWDSNSASFENSASGDDPMSAI